ncbi:MAG: S8 family serine peptidase [Rhabdochlamydiaceae bacterium]|nr:S8 family serine peptidase [Rhabdochlamydiaceae bacterium]
MASSSVSSAASSSLDLQFFSAWEKTYWEQGPIASSEYCGKKVSEIKKIINLLHRIKRLPVSSELLVEELPDQIKTYKTKMLHYQKDRITLSRIDDLIRTSYSGRGELGRTPLNYPSFRKRFVSLHKLSNYVYMKFKDHQCSAYLLKKCLELDPLKPERLKKVRRAGVFTFCDRALIEKWSQFHINAKTKWVARHQFLSNPSLDAAQLTNVWLIPNTSATELEMMHFEKLHKDDVLGRGAAVTVLEGGVDPSHSRFKVPIEHDRENRASLADIQHGTFVCGIISQAAPLAKIKVSPKVTPPSDDSGEVLNFSAWFQDHILTFMDKPSLLTRHITTYYGSKSPFFEDVQNALRLPHSPKKRTLRQLSQYEQEKASNQSIGDLSKSLLIQAIGNRGVILDQNDLVVQGHHWVSSSKERRDRSILVVNMCPNGLYPAASSCLPGKDLAEVTISAIGTNVRSTLPGDRIEARSGTSFAAPFVTSAVLLIQEKFPLLSKGQVRSCILKGATPIILDDAKVPHFVDPGELHQYSSEKIRQSREIYGWGLLNAKRSLELAEEIDETLNLAQLASESLDRMMKKFRTPASP